MIHDMIMAAAGASVAAPSDADFENVTLLLHGDGTNGAQNNTFLDSSTNNFTITRNGNTTQGTFSPFSKVDGRWGNYLGTTSDRLTTSSSNAAFSFGTGDFTVEGFVNLNAIADCMIFQMSTASTGYNNSTSNTVAAYIGGTNKFEIYAANTSTASTNAVVTSSDIGQWRHFAIVRSSGTTKVYWNGSEVAGLTSVSDTTNYSMTYCVIGTVFNNTYALKGYLSNFRVLKGTALYSGSTITVPTGPLTAITNTDFLISQSNRFVDNSSNAIGLTVSGSPKVTPFSPFPTLTAYDAATNGGSGYFDGSGDYLSTSSAVSALNFGTGAFTVEAWLYQNARSGTQWIIGGGGGFQLAINSSGFIFGSAAGVGDMTAATTAVPLSAWTHIAIVRSSTSSGGVAYYINGVAAGTATSSTNFSLDLTLNVGTTNGNVSVSPFNGYISNLRVVKSAVYTTGFTPPTSPVTAITNTSLLLNFTNAGIIDNTMSNNLETVGNAQIDTTTKKYGTGSMEFDGTGDWLTIANTPDLQLGTGNFTVEFWVYLATGDTGSNRGLVGKGGASTGWLVSLNTTQKVVFTYASSTITSSGAITTNAWNHIAVVREGTGSNQTKIYIGGTNDGTGTVSTDFNQTEIMYVGANRTGGDPMKGFIDDLRITKGKARYTSNFTPPTAALPDIGE